MDRAVLVVRVELAEVIARTSQDARTTPGPYEGGTPDSKTREAGGQVARIGHDDDTSTEGTDTK